MNIKCKYHPNSEIIRDDFENTCRTCGLVLSRNDFTKCSIANQLKIFSDLKIENYKLVKKWNLDDMILKKSLSIARHIVKLHGCTILHREAISYSCVFISLRSFNHKLSFKELCSTSSLSVRTIGRALKRLMKHLKSRTVGVDVLDIVCLLCTHLHKDSDLVTDPVKLATQDLTIKVVLTHLVNHRAPYDIVAAALLAIVNSQNEKITLEEFASKLQTSSESIQEIYDCLLHNRQRLNY